jgi:hypothetical protein
MASPYAPPATSEPGKPDEPPRKPSWRMLRGTIIALVAVFFVETMLSGLFLLGIAGGLVTLAVALSVALRRRQPGLIIALKVLLPIVMVAAAIGTNLGNMALARARARHLVDVCERYKAEQGRYPDRLEDLVPRYLSSVPLAKLSLAFNRFYYSHHEGRHSLMYIVLPPFGRTFYDFEKKRWGSLD